MAEASPNIQETVDNEHLKLLSIFHYVVGGMHIAFASLFIFHFVFALMLALKPEMFAGKGEDVPPGFIGYFFAAFVGVFILVGWILGALTVYSGLCIKKRTKHFFSLVMGGINCILFPFGTVLGVFTIIVLIRESVKRIYGSVSE